MDKTEHNIVLDFEPILYHSMPDTLNRCMFTLFWQVDYIPGLYGPGPFIRGQVFFSDPREYGFPLPQETQIEWRRK